MNQVWDGGSEVGWFYQGNNSKLYFQPNYSTSAGVNYAVGIGFASVGVQPGTYGPVTPWNGSLPAGSTVSRCASKGPILV